MENRHLWQGSRISDKRLRADLDDFTRFTSPILGSPFPLEYLLDVMQRFHEELQGRGAVYGKLLDRAMRIHGADREKTEAMLETVISFIARDSLVKKLRRELGAINPLAVERPSMKEEPFEGWLPLGVLVHVAPTNVFSVGVLCVVEGLLSGNINILKTSSGQHQLVQTFFEALLAFDSRSLLAPYIIILEVSSKERELLGKIIALADVVSAWGSEEAIESLRGMTPSGVRFVEWGHKISFAYFSRETLDDTDAMRRVCEDVCLLDQNGCSSPQDVFLETDDFAEVKRFAATFAEVLGEVSQQMVGETPSPPVQAEISTVVSIARAEEALELTRVIRAEDFSWSVIADRRPALAVSPLFRTVLIKPLPEEDIIPTLHPMKSYLQTVALIAPKERIIPLAQKLFGAGCLRIRRAGHMHDGYGGEPHDGVYALPSFMKRVSLVLEGQMDGIPSFRQFQEPFQPDPGDTPVMDKSDFQALKIAPEFVDLTFKSGGSSGKTTYSCFTYEDYNTHMQAAARGLFATGLDPRQDRAINLFAAGHLYGGFLSFFTILENLFIAQYPMGIDEDLEVVGRLIVQQKINTILTLPTLVMKLFHTNAALFKEQPVVKKIIFGGDHFPAEQILYLQEEFGVELIRAIYGSNDAGVLGYQCPHCDLDEYHLLSELNALEVFGFDEERTLAAGRTGRLVFTSKQRRGQNIQRYDVGDTGFLHTAPCPCGRRDPKLTLMGRSSDAFKAGGPFLNYAQFRHCLEKFCGYNGQSQILLTSKGQQQQLQLRVEADIGHPAGEVASLLIGNYEELRISVEDLGLNFQVVPVKAEDFSVVAHSGKVMHLIDRRGTK